MPCFVYLFITDGNLGCFHFLAIMRNAAMTVHLQVFCGLIFSVTLSIYLDVELLGPKVTNYLRNCQIIFCSDCILHSHH